MIYFFLFTIGVGVFYLVGLVFLVFIDRERSLFGRPLFMLALALPIGMAFISCQMFIYSLVSLPFGFFEITIPWIVILILLLCFDIIKFNDVLIFKKSEYFDFSKSEKLLFFVLFFQFLYLCSFSIYSYHLGWDAEHIWFLKAKAFFIDGGVTKEFILDRRFFDSHGDYPLMVPLSLTWLYVTLGSVDDRIVKLIYPLQYLSLLIIFFYTVKSFASRQYALGMTLLLSVVPIVQAHSGGYPESLGGLYTANFVGYADLTLALCFLSASGCFYLYTKKNESTFFFLAMFFFAISGWVKKEGLAFMVSGFLIACIYTYLNDRARFKQFLASMAFPLFFVMPWMIYKSVIGVSGVSDFKFELLTLTDILSRSEIIFNRLVLKLLDVDLFTTVWVFYFLSFVFYFKRNFQKPFIFMNILLFFQLGASLMAYMFSAKDLYFHLLLSLDRVLLHLTPLAFLIVSMCTYEFFRIEEGSKVGR